MRKNPERLAWTVLATAFVTFCVLAVSIPLGIRSYVLNAVEDQAAELRVIEGTILIQEATKSGLTAVTDGTSLLPGEEVLTDDTSWGTIDLFERSHLTLYNNTTITLKESNTPQFGPSDRPDEIRLDVTGGLLRAGVALPGERPTSFRVATPHTSLDLEEGSYRIEVSNDGTQITVARGQAVVIGDGYKMAFPQGTRTFVTLGNEPPVPLPAARNLIDNGDFQQPLETTWLTNTAILDPAVQPPSIEIVENGGRRAALLLQRDVEDGDHTEVAIQQSLDQDVRDFVRLEISLDVMLDYQSLSGGGQLSSEFPIIVRLDYKDRWGKDQFWTHGFFYQNQAGYPIALDPWQRPSGEMVPRGVWYPFESGNLLELLGESGPVHLTGLTVYASGWNYEGQVSEIQVIVE